MRRLATTLRLVAFYLVAALGYALGLPLAEVFQPLYGPGSAGQFRAHAVALDLPFEGLALQNIVEDVDTLDDLRRVGTRAGARTRAILEAIPS